MTDDKYQVDAPDTDRINLGESKEVKFWSQWLGVEPADLRAAVRSVGPVVTDVREHLDGDK